MKIVKIKLNLNTETAVIKTENFEGESCMDIDAALDEMLDNIVTEKTDEYFIDSGGGQLQKG